MNTLAAMVPHDAFIAVYMTSNRKHGTLSSGVTSIDGPIHRETSLKKYNRHWKINLIECDN